MANDDEKLPPFPPQQQQGWQPEPWWPQPQSMQQRNPLLYMQQATDLPPPQEPPLPPKVSNAALSGASMGMVTLRGELTLTPGAPVNEEIEARFQEALRRAADLTSFIDQLRKASTGREIGPGHNQGPPLPIEEVETEVEHLILLLRERGPKTKGTVDLKPLIEQTEKTKGLSERIWNWSKTVALAVAVIGGNEILKDLTKPLWEELAQKISDFCLAIATYASLM